MFERHTKLTVYMLYSVLLPWILPAVEPAGTPYLVLIVSKSIKHNTSHAFFAWLTNKCTVWLPYPHAAMHKAIRNSTHAYNIVKTHSMLTTIMAVCNNGGKITGMIFWAYRIGRSSQVQGLTYTWIHILSGYWIIIVHIFSKGGKKNRRESD